jgi:hypothetical protein
MRITRPGSVPSTKRPTLWITCILQAKSTNRGAAGLSEPRHLSFQRNRAPSFSPLRELAGRPYTRSCEIGRFPWLL